MGLSGDQPAVETITNVGGGQYEVLAQNGLALTGEGGPALRFSCRATQAPTLNSTPSCGMARITISSTCRPATRSTVRVEAYRRRSASGPTRAATTTGCGRSRALPTSLPPSPTGPTKLKPLHGSVDRMDWLLEFEGTKPRYPTVHGSRQLRQAHMSRNRITVSDVTVVISRT